MPRNSHNRQATLVLAVGMLLAGLAMFGSSPASAFGMGGGFGRVGGFARPAPRLGAGPRAAKLPRHRGERISDVPRNGRRPPTEGGGRHHRIGRIGIGTGIDRNGAAPPSLRAGEPGSAGGGNRGGGAPPSGAPRFVPDQVIVAFAPSASPQAIARLVRRYALAEIESQNFSLIGERLSLWHIGGRRSVASVVAALSRQGLVASAQPNFIFSLSEQLRQNQGGENGGTAQYVLAKMQVEQAQSIATGRDVFVAVIDSQIDSRHPDLDSSIVRSFDALGGDAAPQLHGTEMAGAIAAHGKLLGIAPSARLLAARAFDAHDGGTSFAIYKSLEWAADNGARIVNMSFAGPADSMLHRILAAAAARDIVLVAAAGNAGPDSAPLYPAADSNVIAVTATDMDDHLFAMANRGRYIAVAAPGVDILALAPDHAYATTTGTSVAAAHVTGVAALLLQHDPSLRPSAIRAILMATAKPLAQVPNAEFGAGLANAYRAMLAPPRAAAGRADDPEQAKR